MGVSALNYTKCAVVVHGKSELYLVKYIYTNLHLPVKPIAKNKGKSSIQINGLMDFLNKKPFTNLKKFADEYNIEYDRKRKELLNFKLFIIMDTDDCSDKAKQEYISGSMFKEHILYPYIVPIYNIEKLEDVMIKANIMAKRIKDNEKGDYYSKIFPINSGPMNSGTIGEVKEFASKIKNIKQTNMLEFIEYCLGFIGR
ncbi:MAG: hypothetical protein ACI4VF_03055 [Lachnospirales bacterium]